MSGTAIKRITPQVFKQAQTQMKEFQTSKSDITQVRLAESQLDSRATLAEGELLLEIDKFGFSANNVTYAAAGDQLGYWKFFPASDNAAGNWGVIPVWGFANIVKSSTAGVEVGERIFGYFPTGNYLKTQNVEVFDNRLVDGAEHRSRLPAGYNTYRRVDFEPGYDSSMDAYRMLLWPLYVTSYCLWDSLQHKKWHGAKQVLIVSASSKTSIGLAYALAADASATTSIGLTSAGNLDWVKSLDIYDQTVSYDALTDIDASKPSVIVDMSGNAGLLSRIAQHLGDNLAFCLNVGLTHWDKAGQDTGIPQDKREFFFAPSHIQMRMKEWGPAEFEKRSSRFVLQVTQQSAQWMQLENLSGVEALAEVYRDVCDGTLAPEKGLVIKTAGS